MNTIAILPEPGEDNLTTFSAVTTGHKATGRTAGEALDALTAQLSAERAAAPVIIQQFQPDQFFPAAQRDRLSALMARWRAARETGGSLPPGEQAELESLIDEEVQGSSERAAQILLGNETMTTRSRNVCAEELSARYERESRNNSPGVFSVGIFILFFVHQVLYLILRDSTSADIILIIGLTWSAVGLLYFLLVRHRSAARERAAIRYLDQFMRTRSEGDEFSTDRAKRGEQTKVR